ncbi:MAG: tRNA (adenosine(37)-N6)-threonylcarbamoyltransferase complex transferase subunit TsaD [Actinomycetota bacterium]|nr:tRNA (adenosine(37)-N6)-threonylcarbamoyltransferase complex transferase subunit TsaD [Actinomycetota bacterium]
MLGIETSCDETAAAVVDASGVVRSSVVSSQVDLHAAYGGVVPELAGRAHLSLLTPVVAAALERAGLPLPSGTGSASARGRCGDGAAGAPVDAAADVVGAGTAVGQAGWGVRVDAVAATVGPGLIGALLVGASQAKGLALAWDVPFVGVNHLEGHCFAALLDHRDLAWPLVVLLVSGGHSMILAMDGPGRYRLLGQTLDDAAGEAFDKVARFLGLGYPGGPAIERAAASGDPGAFAFPRALADSGLDLSFSGLKTAVVHAVRKHPDAGDADVAASFQQAVVDVLLRKTMRAAAELPAAGVCLAGGVAANGPLRAAFAAACDAAGLPLYLPSRSMCTDNAAMVAAAGAWQLEHLGPSPLDTPADPGAGLPLGEGRVLVPAD